MPSPSDRVNQWLHHIQVLAGDIGYARAQEIAPTLAMIQDCSRILHGPIRSLQGR